MKYRFNLLPDSFKPRDLMEMGRWFVFLVLFLFMVGLVVIGFMYEKRFIDIQRSRQSIDFISTGISLSTTYRFRKTASGGLPFVPSGCSPIKLVYSKPYLLP